MKQMRGAASILVQDGRPRAIKMASGVASGLAVNDLVATDIISLMSEICCCLV
jgi:hypothetical protein